MPSEKEHWIKNPWVVGSVLILLTPPITGLWDFIKGIPFFTTVSLLWHWFVSFELKLWWICVYILFLGLISAIKEEIRKNKNFVKPQHILRTYLRFTAVKYGNFKWRWTWRQDVLTKDIEISNLLPVCPAPACNNNPLHYSRTDTRREGSSTVNTPYYKCSTCNAEYLVEKQPRDVEYYITQLIERDSFKETTKELPEFCYTGN